MFTGLSAFPLTPISENGIDESAFAGLIDRLAVSKVDSLGVLGSTGSYAYLTREERARAVEIAVEHAGGAPVLVGVGAPATHQVLALVEDAQDRGATAMLLPAVTYQPLSDDEVYGLYADVAAFATIPIVVYDNPTTTHVTFSDDLHARIAQLPGIASIKIPPVSPNLEEVRARVARLRTRLPEHVTIGISGDAVAAVSLVAGCDGWYSGVAGILPEPCLAITRAALAGDSEEALRLSAALEPLWRLTRKHGGYRIASIIAEHLELAPSPNLPRPVQGLTGTGREAVVDALTRIGITQQ
ncbi:MAG: dihydrodipicolinate synthase family protein [Lacisediminihabitans sp.]